MSRLKSRLKPSAEFSSSSMADLVFLLLIFFMLTSSFVTQAGVSITLPNSESEKSSDGKNAVTISEDGRYFWNEREAGIGAEEDLKKAEIASEIEKVLTDEDEENNVVTLRVDKEVTMEKAGFVISQIAKYGGKVVIATEKE
ncbi:MAG: biopolymer transporter ExbD [Bacteroidia bacterium]|nr:biopolymer transporter ExbD [Bacteroidia bacterium]